VCGEKKRLKTLYELQIIAFLGTGNFDQKLGSNSFYALAVQIWLKTVQNDWCDVGRPQVAMHCNCHLF